MIRVQDEASGVRVATLDRPPANAIEESLLADLERVVDEAAADDRVRALVLTGSGRFFCGGFDLKVARRDDDTSTAMVAAYRSSHRKLFALPKPTVALVQGHAVAGGLVLALACDHRVFADCDYTIGVNEVAIGAAYPGAAIEIVRCRLTHAAANELVLQASLLPAAEAVRLGLVDRFTPAADAAQHALALAARLGSYPQAVYAHAKQHLIGDALARIDAIPLDEEYATAALWTTAESRAARQAHVGSL